MGCTSPARRPPTAQARPGYRSEVHRRLLPSRRPSRRPPTLPPKPNVRPRACRMGRIGCNGPSLRKMRPHENVSRCGSPAERGKAALRVRRGRPLVPELPLGNERLRSSASRPLPDQDATPLPNPVGGRAPSKIGSASPPRPGREAGLHGGVPKRSLGTRGPGKMRVAGREGKAALRVRRGLVNFARRTTIPAKDAPRATHRIHARLIRRPPAPWRSGWEWPACVTVRSSIITTPGNPWCKLHLLTAAMVQLLARSAWTRCALPPATAG